MTGYDAHQPKRDRTERAYLCRAYCLVFIDRDDLKEILRGLIDRIIFDYSNMDCCIHYKIPAVSWNLEFGGVPNEIRTRVTAVKGRCPRPLDDRDFDF